MGKEEISKAEHGDVIKYKNDYGGHNYLVVQNVENGMVNGQIASPIGVNGVTIDELVKKKAVFLREEKK